MSKAYGTNLMRNLFLLLLTNLFLNVGFSQVTKVKYLTRFNDASGLYEFCIVVTEGSIGSTPSVQRIQFGSQYTVAVPAASTVGNPISNMPLKNNLNGTGSPTDPNTPPNPWQLSSLATNITGPTGPTDYYAIVPSTAVTSHYNPLNLNDTILLFKLSISLPSGQCKSSVRNFINGVDPGPTAAMGYGDYSNGFVIGYTSSNTQDYDGNISAINVNSPVTNVNDQGVGSLRYAIGCAVDGSTIKINDNILADTIKLLSKIDIDKNLNILQTSAKILKIKSPNSGPSFNILANKNFKLAYLSITASPVNIDGRCLKNYGILTLNNVLLKDPRLGQLGCSIQNFGQLKLEGICKLTKL